MQSFFSAWILHFAPFMFGHVDNKAQNFISRSSLEIDDSS